MMWGKTKPKMSTAQYLMNGGQRPQAPATFAVPAPAPAPQLMQGGGMIGTAPAPAPQPEWEKQAFGRGHVARPDDYGRVFNNQNWPGFDDLVKEYGLQLHQSRPGGRDFQPRLVPDAYHANPDWPGYEQYVTDMGITSNPVPVGGPNFAPRPKYKKPVPFPGWPDMEK